MNRKLWKCVELPNSRSFHIGTSLTFVRPQTESTIIYMASNGKHMQARLTLHVPSRRGRLWKQCQTFSPLRAVAEHLTTCTKQSRLHLSQTIKLRTGTNHLKHLPLFFFFSDKASKTRVPSCEMIHGWMDRLGMYFETNEHKTCVLLSNTDIQCWKRCTRFWGWWHSLVWHPTP